MSESFRLETQGKKHLDWKWWSLESGFKWKLVTIGGKAATVLVTPTCRRRLAVEPSSPCLLDVPWDPPSLWEPWQSWLPQHALDDRQYCKRIPSKNCSSLFDSWGIYGIILILFRNGLFCLQRNYHRLPRFIYCICHLVMIQADPKSLKGHIKQHCQSRRDWGQAAKSAPSKGQQLFYSPQKVEGFHFFLNLATQATHLKTVKEL